MGVMKLAAESTAAALWDPCLLLMVAAAVATSTCRQGTLYAKDCTMRYLGGQTDTNQSNNNNNNNQSNHK